MARTTTESEGEYTCKSCGAKERANYIQPIKEQMLTKQFCYNCNYWDEFRKSPHICAQLLSMAPFITLESAHKATSEVWRDADLTSNTLAGRTNTRKLQL